MRRSRTGVRATWRQQIFLTSIGESHMTKQTVTNLLAGAIIAVGAVSLARPAQAAEVMEECYAAHADAVEEGREACGSLGYTRVTVTTSCTNGTATGSTIRCHN
jgi:hypothetical protein